MEIAHGEGRFVANQDRVDQLEADGRVVFRYSPSDFVTAPYNPNGSMNDIAGICDETGLILGMMPHPERSIEAFHPYRPRTAVARSAAQTIFNNIVSHIKAA